MKYDHTTWFIRRIGLLYLLVLLFGGLMVWEFGVVARPRARPRAVIFAAYSLANGTSQREMDGALNDVEAALMLACSDLTHRTDDETVIACARWYIGRIKHAKDGE